MREQFRDRYLQYDDPIAEHRMLWRAHSLPPEECISCRLEYRRPMQLERLRSKVRATIRQFRDRRKASYGSRVNAGSRLALCQNCRARQLKP